MALFNVHDQFLHMWKALKSGWIRRTVLLNLFEVFLKCVGKTTILISMGLYTNQIILINKYKYTYINVILHLCQVCLMPFSSTHCYFKAKTSEVV